MRSLLKSTDKETETKTPVEDEVCTKNDTAATWCTCICKCIDGFIQFKERVYCQKYYHQ